MSFRVVSIVLILGGFSASAQAYEVDQFTRRDVRPRQDGLEVVNARVNAEIDAAILAANARLERLGGRCLPGDAASRKRITEALWNRLVGANPVKSRFESWLMKLPDDELLVSTRAIDSIYNHPRYQLVVIGNMIVPEIELGGIRVGTDKIGHFFQIGHRLHRESIARGGVPIPCDELDRLTSEQGYYGCGSGGFVYSYGDMAANVAGQKFWDRVYGAAGPTGAYVICGSNGRFRRNPEANDFTFADYASPLWDEAVNCSLDCDGRKNRLSGEVTTIQERTGLYECPFRRVEVPWGPARVSAREFCSELAGRHGRQDPFFESVYTWGSSCVEEVVSPVCLGTAMTPMNRKRRLGAWEWEWSASD